MKTHKDLRVWEEAVNYVTKIYKLSSAFPKSEIYGLTNQMRRAATSIPSNLAEGAARRSKKEWIQFLYIALGSASELDTQLLIAKNLEFIDDDSYSKFQIELENISKMLNGLIKHAQREA